MVQPCHFTRDMSAVSCSLSVQLFRRCIWNHPGVWNSPLPGPQTGNFVALKYAPRRDARNSLPRNHYAILVSLNVCWLGKVIAIASPRSLCNFLSDWSLSFQTMKISDRVFRWQEAPKGRDWGNECVDIEKVLNQKSMTWSTRVVRL